VEVQLLNTSWLLPQNRERFFFIGSLTTGSGTKVFPITENDCRSVKGAKQATDTLIDGGGEIVNTLTAGGNSGGMHSSMTLLRV